MAFNRCMCVNPQLKFGTQQYKKKPGSRGWWGGVGVWDGGWGGQFTRDTAECLNLKKGILRNIRDTVTIDLVHPVPFLFLMVFWEAHFAPFDPWRVH